MLFGDFEGPLPTEYFAWKKWQRLFLDPWIERRREPRYGSLTCTISLCKRRKSWWEKLLMRCGCITCVKCEVDMINSAIPGSLEDKKKGKITCGACRTCKSREAKSERCQVNASGKKIKALSKKLLTSLSWLSAWKERKRLKKEREEALALSKLEREAVRWTVCAVAQEMREEEQREKRACA